MLIAVAACAWSGCWKEIHYSPPPESRADESEVAPNEQQAENFADDVATSLAEDAQPAPPSPGETASAVGVSAPPSSTPTPTPSPPPPETIASVEPNHPAPETPEPAASETIDVEPSHPEANTPEPAHEPIAAPAPASNPARSPRRAAWSLGSTWSLAALANDRAAAADKVDHWYDTARQQADFLGATLPDLPPRPDAAHVDPLGNRAMEYLFGNGPKIGKHLGTAYGDDHSALFEIALNSNLLLVRYQPGTTTGKLFSAAISQASERAKLPAELTEPLLKLLDENAPVKEVRDAVFDMHAAVDHYLTTEQP